MACGGCGARRAAAKGAAPGAVVQYRVTWGDGSDEKFSTYSEARLAMGRQTDQAKRRGMRITNATA